MTTLNEFINNLIKIRDEHDLGNLEVYTARDEEGNGYDPIYFHPSIYFANKHDKHDIISEESFSEMESYDQETDDYEKIVVVN